MREQTRRTLFYYLDVLDFRSKEVLGSLADISLKGCLIITEKPFVEGQEFLMQVKLPNGGGFAEERLCFQTVVRWIRKEKGRPLYYAGMRITKREKSTTPVIKHLIEHLGFSDGQKKIHLSNGRSDYTE